MPDVRDTEPATGPDPEIEPDDLHDDLYWEMHDEVRERLLFSADADGLMAVVEAHADRRTARALRILAQVVDYPTDRELLEAAADRIDPDVGDDDAPARPPRSPESSASS